ncbi:MAG: VOC family protein, partial [Bacteroidia bacterium]
MPSLLIYLMFNGNCREAMLFYQQCLGGELSFQTIADTPQATHLPEKVKNYILHAALRKDDFEIAGTDMINDSGLVKGNAVSILLRCKSDKELRSYFKLLSAGGETELKVSKTDEGKF